MNPVASHCLVGSSPAIGDWMVCRSGKILRSLPIERSPRGYGIAEAERFVTRLAERLCVGTECLVPGLEDTVYYLWKRGRSPSTSILSRRM